MLICLWMLGALKCMYERVWLWIFVLYMMWIGSWCALIGFDRNVYSRIWIWLGFCTIFVIYGLNSKFGIVFNYVFSIRVVFCFQFAHYGLCDKNWVWFLVFFRVRNSVDVWYTRSSEQGSPRRRYQKCKTVWTRVSRLDECISPRRALISVVCFCLGTSPRRRILF